MSVTKKKKKSKGGRKPVSDPKIQVHFWIEGSKVKAVGGMEDARLFCIESMTEKAKNIE